MAYQQYILASVFVLFLCLQNGFGLMCYECNSHNDTRCAMEDLPDELIKPCAHREGKPFSLCRKIKQIIEFEVNGLPPDNRVIRGCGWDDSTYKNRCYHRSGFGGRQEVCACDADKCNGSSTIYASVSLLLGMFALLKISLWMRPSAQKHCTDFKTISGIVRLILRLLQIF